MNAITKVFVVLMVLFSITFTMMTIQFAATVPNWRAEAEKWKTRAETVDASNRNLTAAKVAEATKSATERERWNSERSDLLESNGDLQRVADEQKARVAELEAQLAAKDASVKMFVAELKVSQESAEKARDHRRELEQRNIDLEKRTADLTEALNENISTVIVLEQQTRQQEQAVALLRDERDKLLKKLNLRGTALDEVTVTMPIDRVRPAPSASVSPIRGRVNEVGRDYASVSVGSNDGVAQDMVFIIYNQNGYLGDLVITEVRPNEAAGRLKNINGLIGVGDLVTDETGYLAMK